MKKWRYVVLFSILATSAFIVFLAFREPTGLEQMGGNQETIATLGLWSAIAGAVAAFFSLLKDVIGLFNKEKK